MLGTNQDFQMLIMSLFVQLEAIVMVKNRQLKMEKEQTPVLTYESNQTSLCSIQHGKGFLRERLPPQKKGMRRGRVVSHWIQSAMLPLSESPGLTVSTDSIGLFLE